MFSAAPGPPRAAAGRHLPLRAGQYAARIESPKRQREREVPLLLQKARYRVKPVAVVVPEFAWVRILPVSAWPERASTRPRRLRTNDRRAGKLRACKARFAPPTAPAPNPGIDRCCLAQSGTLLRWGCHPLLPHELGESPPMSRWSAGGKKRFTKMPKRQPPAGALRRGPVHPQRRPPGKPVGFGCTGAF